MKTGAIIAISTGVITAAGVGIVMALNHPPSGDLPAVDTGISPPSEEPNDGNPAEDALTTPSDIAASDTTTADDMTAAAQTELRDFPHEPIQVRDEVDETSDFGQFRRQFRQALRDRNEAFIVPLLPTYEDGTLAYGFGVLQLEQANLDATHSWFWSVLDKAMAQGCVSNPADQWQVDTDAEVVWVCPGIAQAFEDQFPPPDDALGIDHYIDHVIVLGENVNVRSEPSTDSEVIALLSNEVVNSNQAGWDVVYADLAEGEYPDAIDSWTPVTLPNEKTGYVYSRYTHFPLDPRLVFGKQNGQWTVLMIPAGD